MVKNTHGGSSHKKFARKHNGGSHSNKLRVSEDNAEIYAIVTKMLGNNMFHCHCLDGEVRLGHIRGKFTGRSKRDNIVERGKWVLIGLRDWDAPSRDKLQHCDLLEVYSDTDKHRLRESVEENWSILDTNDVTNESIKEFVAVGLDESNFTFATEQDFERERLLKKMQSNTTERITMGTETASVEDDINFDEI